MSNMTIVETELAELRRKERQNLEEVHALEDLLLADDKTLKKARLWNPNRGRYEVNLTRAQVLVCLREKYFEGCEILEAMKPLIDEVWQGIEEPKKSFWKRIFKK